MIQDKQVYWISFDIVCNPRRSNIDTFRYNTFTAVITNDDFTKVSDRKSFLIDSCKNKLIDWHKKHKFTPSYSKEDYNNNILIFTEGKVTCTFKNFIVKKVNLNI